MTGALNRTSGLYTVIFPGEWFIITWEQFISTSKAAKQQESKKNHLSNLETLNPKKNIRKEKQISYKWIGIVSRPCNVRLFFCKWKFSSILNIVSTWSPIFKSNIKIVLEIFFVKICSVYSVIIYSKWKYKNFSFDQGLIVATQNILATFFLIMI